MLSRRTRNAPEQGPAHDRPDVFLSYSSVDKEFAEGRLTKALAEHGKDVWIDVEDIRGGASDWRAAVWAGIEAKVVVFVLTPDSLASTVCGEELAGREAEQADRPPSHRPVKVCRYPKRSPNPTGSTRPEDFETDVKALIAAIEPTAVGRAHARLTQRTGKRRPTRTAATCSAAAPPRRRAVARPGRPRRGTDHRPDHITASRRAAARRQRGHWRESRSRS
jgi:hypothetical protein